MDTRLSEYQQVIGANIARIRNEQSLSVRKLAQMIDMDYSYISKIENGKGNPTLDRLCKIAAGLGVELEELVKIHPEDDTTYTALRM